MNVYSNIIAEQMKSDTVVKYILSVRKMRTYLSEAIFETDHIKELKDNAFLTLFEIMDCAR